MSVKRANPLSQINWSEYFGNKAERNKATYVINSNGSYYLYDGMVLKEKDFEMMIPIEIIRTNPKGDNVDGKYVC